MDFVNRSLSDVYQYLMGNWEPILAYFTALASIGGYFIARATDRAWKRTEFLFQQMHYLDNDAELREAVAILDGRHPTATVELVFGEASSLGKAPRDAFAVKFDKLLNLFQRLAYAVLKAKTLSKAEIAPFGWYIEKTLGHPLLVTYCEENGFDDLVELAKCLPIEVANPNLARGTGP